MEIFVQQFINALSLGGTYALLALGLAMVFSVLGLINFAHGELMTIRDDLESPVSIGSVIVRPSTMGQGVCL